MFSIIETIFTYNIILITSLFFFLLYNRKRKKIYKLLPYILIFLLSTLRYDIGYDYENSVRSILQIEKSFEYFNPLEVWEFMGKEPMMFFLTSLFGKIEHSFVFVLSVYNFIFIFYIYKTFERYNVHLLGVFILFVLIILFQSWDWIRQSVSLSIFLYSFKYIENKEFKKYCSYVLFASLWHYSAFILLIIYPLVKIKIPPKSIAIILFLFFLMVELQMFNSLFENILKYIPYYGDVYLKSMYSKQGEFKYYSLPFIMYSLWYIVIVKPIMKYNANMGIVIFWGSILFMISSGNLLLDRISWYFTSVQLIAVPLICKKRNFTVNRMIIYLFLFSHFLYFNRQIINGGLRGSSQYISVFSYEYEHKLFKSRMN